MPDSLSSIGVSNLLFLMNEYLRSEVTSSVFDIKFDLWRAGICQNRANIGCSDFAAVGENDRFEPPYDVIQNVQAYALWMRKEK